ncbi:MAG: ATPase, partial [Chloroflexota bacterium]|nr:ATPase [Chloroflexota bacterium]
MDDTIDRPANQDGAVDMLYLVDRLEELVSLGKRVPFSTRVMVEEEEFLALVDQLRVAVPNEIKQAQRVIKERERIIGEAQDEAAEIV